MNTPGNALPRKKYTKNKNNPHQSVFFVIPRLPPWALALDKVIPSIISGKIDSTKVMPKKRSDVLNHINHSHPRNENGSYCDITIETKNETDNINETKNETDNINETKNETDNMNETNNVNKTKNETNNINDIQNETDTKNTPDRDCADIMNDTDNMPKTTQHQTINIHEYDDVNMHHCTVHHPHNMINNEQTNKTAISHDLAPRINKYKNIHTEHLSIRMSPDWLCVPEIDKHNNANTIIYTQSNTYNISEQYSAKKIEIENVKTKYSDSLINSLVKETSRKHTIIMSNRDNLLTSTDTNEKQIDHINQAKIIAAGFSAILKRFHVLKDLQGGQKIWIITNPATESAPETKVFTIDGSYIPSVSRWWWAQNREAVINTIIDDTNYIQKNFDKVKGKAKPTVCAAARFAIIGIRNMRQTYGSNTDHVDKLGKIIDVLQEYADMVH